MLNKNNMKNERIGETRMMKCGMKATIIGYEDANHIKVQFENGETVYPRQYLRFKNGLLSSPKKSKENRLGQTRLMNCGREATIIEYIESNNITVRFTDGSVVSKRTYYQFLKGTIKHPALKHSALKDRTGETKILANGEIATIIAYRGVRDIDVKVGNDVFYNMYYKTFKKGTFKNKKGESNIRYDRIGIKKKMNNGLYAEITSYRSSADMDIIYEDGYEVKHVRWEHFKNGFVMHPKKLTKYSPASRKEERIGEKAIMKNGMEATIVNYRNCNDIDIQFKNGKTVYNRTYQEFTNRCICTDNQKNKNFRLERIGQKNIMRNGQMACIIDYRNRKDIDVQFEDGTIVKGKQYYNFKLGNIKNPNYKKE